MPSNSKIIFYEQVLKRQRCKKSIVLSVISIENLRTLKHHTFSEKHYLFLLFVISVAEMMKNIFKKRIDWI